MTEKPSNIYTALAAAQLEFGTVRKGATNPAFRSKYADLSDVATVVIPTLAEKGVCVLHYITGEGLDVMRTEFVHGESGTKIFCDVRLIVSKNDMQGMKSATTYAKRIGLESLSGIAPEDDDGNAAVVAAPKQQPRQQPLQRPAESRKITPEEFQEMKSWLEKTGSNEESFLGWLKAVDLHTISIEQWNVGMTALRKKPVIKEEEQ